MSNNNTAYVETQLGAARRCFENLELPAAEIDRALANLRGKLERFVAEQAR